MFAGEKPDTTLTLDWIRHGEPEGGVKYRGSLDDPLSTTGWQQMRSTVDKALQAGTRWNAVIASPLLRCHAFATEIATQQQLPLTVLPDLRELCFGELEGLTPKQAWTQYPELLKNLWQAPEKHTPPGGELFTDFLVRVQRGIDHILQQHAGQHVLVVVHGGTIRAMLTCCLGFTPRDTFKVEVPYAGMTRTKAYLHGDHAEFALQFINGFRP